MAKPRNLMNKEVLRLASSLAQPESGYRAALLNTQRGFAEAYLYPQ